MSNREVVLIVGAGSGLSAAIARRFARDGAQVVVAARDVAKLTPLSEQIGARAIACDATDRQAVAALFSACDADPGTPDVVVYNAGYRARGPFVELDADAVWRTLEVCAFGAFLVAQQAARRMLANGRGVLLFTGASASVKGYPQSAPFAMGKFALRGLAQSLARELQPRNIHVAHVVIDGGIREPGRAAAAGESDSQLDPDAIAETYRALARQPRSAWASEIELRPWVEMFWRRRPSARRHHHFGAMRSPGSTSYGGAQPGIPRRRSRHAAMLGKRPSTS
jgi:NAD(P)-dependent dehydrogenase (short-subunit alcohol dehydrogenase family)